jgi:hypothetical protein
MGRDSVCVCVGGGGGGRCVEWTCVSAWVSEWVGACVGKCVCVCVCVCVWVGSLSLSYKINTSWWARSGPPLLTIRNKN